MAELLLFREEWVVQITHMLHENPEADADEHSEADADPILRVATPLLNAKQEAYIPQMFSLGPYHHGKLEKDIDSSCGGGKISTAEAYKGKSAAKLSQKLRNCGKSFNSIVEFIEKNLQQIEHFYHWPISSNREDEYSKNVALMMAVDSSFLLCFLISLSDNDQSTSDDDIMSLYPYIKHDILKLENQIPLAVLEGVFEEVNSTVVADCNFYQLLQTTLAELSPFPPHNMDIDDVAKERHLLGCMHAFVSKFLEIQTGEGHHQRSTPWQTLKDTVFVTWASCCLAMVCCCLPRLARSDPTFFEGISAGHLSRGGIRFKSFSTMPNQIRFDKCSATLYLPEITVSDMHTEVVLRNMLALEFNNIASHLKPVTRYVALMGYLLQSADDVRLLVDGGVIIRGDRLLTDEGILNMWRGVTQPFFPPSPEVISVVFSGDLEDVLQTKYWKSKVKRTFGEFINIVSTWKFLGSFAVFLGLVLTAIQAYCAVVELLISHGNNWSAISLWEQV